MYNKNDTSAIKNMIKITYSSKKDYEQNKVKLLQYNRSLNMENKNTENKNIKIGGHAIKV